MSNAINNPPLAGQKPTDTTAIGIFTLILWFIIACVVYNTGAYQQLGFLFVLCYAWLRVFVGAWVYDIAKAKGLNEWTYAIWCFFCPSVTLIVLGQKKIATNER